MKLGQGSLVIRNGQIIDGTGAPAISAGALLVKDGKIAYVGPESQLPATPPGTPSIDAKGGTILPGLVEAHFHATYFNIAALED
ncbi:MAG: amidohydrolase family protein, partial [Planctomycetota bacterium]